MFPAVHTVEHRTSAAEGVNALGQSVPVVESRFRKVTGIRPRSTTDGTEAAMAGRVATELYMTTPEPDWADGDVVVVPGAWGCGRFQHFSSVRPWHVRLSGDVAEGSR